MLGDRIAIMAHGKLQCNGSSNFLKRTFGAGYKLIATMAQGAVKLGGGADTSGGEGGIQLSALQMVRQPVRDDASRKDRLPQHNRDDVSRKDQLPEQQHE